MNALFSIKIWLILIERIFNALLPVVLVLLFFAWKGRHSISKNSAFRLFIVFAVVDFSIRLLLFFGGVPYQGRYFHVLIIASCILCGTGFIPFVEFLSSFKKKYVFLTYEKVLVATIVLVTVVHVGKALSPPDGKLWLDEIPALLRENCPKDRKPVLISEDNDIRIAYYAGAENLKLVRLDNTDYLAGALLSVSDSSGKSIDAKSLNDQENGTGMFFEGDLELTISLPDQYTYSRGTFLLKTENLGSAEAILPESSRNPGWTPLEPRQNNEFTYSFVSRPWKILKLQIRTPAGTRWKLNEIGLLIDDEWEILRAGKGYSAGYKFTAVPPKNIHGFAGCIADLGGENVFVLARMTDEKFRQLFKKAGCEFPLKLIAEKRDPRKDYFTLYQGKNK